MGDVWLIACVVEREGEIEIGVDDDVCDGIIAAAGEIAEPDEAQPVNAIIEDGGAVVPCAEHAGWAHFVCVAAPDTVPAVVERRRVTTIDAGLTTMPYHHDSIGMPEGAANQLIDCIQQIRERKDA